MPDSRRELADLVNALCDGRLTQSECAKLERLVLADAESLQWYLRQVEVHGLLHWDAACGEAVAGQGTLLSPALAQPARSPARRSWVQASVVAAVMLCLAGVWMLTNGGGGPDQPGPLADGVDAGRSDSAEATPDVVSPEREAAPSIVRLTPRPVHPPGAAGSADRTGEPMSPSAEGTEPAAMASGGHHSSLAMVDRINEALVAYWQEHDVVPAGEADDFEWYRRVHLHLVGRIPEADDVISFLEDDAPDKRAAVVDDLLSDPQFARHAAKVWSNLLIGHTSPRQVNRPAFEKFLREQFHRNRPWSETVARMISAEGYDDEDGATNFLLAHVNNEAVPATAVTSRVLLCEQVQCTQCHDHPTGEWKQDRFWELNSFFQQTDIVRHRRFDPQSGERLADRLELVNLPLGGPTFYQDRQSRMNVAYPRFAGREVAPDEDVNRREELARLLTEGDPPQLARAMVNRTWQQFFGYGFTDPVDDMGPHNQAVMPELLEDLAGAFVASGYDVKQLIRWICLSRPYQLASVITEENASDKPGSGLPPLFSRAYVRPMSAEQLFDSLLTATHADRAGIRYWDEAEERRRAWLEQFYQALDNDENAEDDSFEGSLTQTLVMMNGELIRQATTPRPGTVLSQILNEPASDEEKIRLLSLATLSREPTREELSSLRRMIRQRVQSRSRGTPADEALNEALRDLMWAYLNSSEFRSIH